MKTSIYKTEEVARQEAKIRAIRQLETYERILVNDDKFINSEKLWFERVTFCHCACG